MVTLRPLLTVPVVDAATNAVGLGTRPVWTLMHHLPVYRDCPRADVAVAENIEQRLVNVPSSPSL